MRMFLNKEGEAFGNLVMFKYNFTNGTFQKIKYKDVKNKVSKDKRFNTFSFDLTRHLYLRSNMIYQGLPDNRLNQFQLEKEGKRPLVAYLVCLENEEEKMHTWFLHRVIRIQKRENKILVRKFLPSISGNSFDVDKLTLLGFVQSIIDPTKDLVRMLDDTNQKSFSVDDHTTIQLEESLFFGIGKTPEEAFATLLTKIEESVNHSKKLQNLQKLNTLFKGSRLVISLRPPRVGFTEVNTVAAMSNISVSLVLSNTFVISLVEDGQLVSLNSLIEQFNPAVTK